MIKLKSVWKILGILLLKRKARRLAKKTGIQQFIIMSAGKARIINKKQFKYLRQHKCFPMHYTASNLKQIALYYTDDKKGVQRPARKVQRQLKAD